MSDHHSPRLARALVSVLVFVATESVHADLLDPLDFSSLGTLNLAGGNVTIDTDALSIVDDAAPGVPLFTGVVDDQDGMADSFGGVPGPLGIPEIAVFTFDSINLASTANITVAGSRALALLSQTNATIDTMIDVSGKSGSHTAGGAGGPGGFAGGFVPTLNGLGPGGGTGGPGQDPCPCLAFNIAAGGSFGGMGQDGTSLNPGGVPIPNEGMTYGSPAVDVLQGGSGGGGMDDVLLSNGNIDSGGGGAGGALEIGAAAQLTIGASGNLVADGSIGAPTSNGPVAGGNGSGGSIRLHGVKVTINGAVSAEDSDVRAATQTNQSVGHGGGGRVRVTGYDFGGDNGEFIPGITDPATIVVTGIDVDNSSSNRGTIALEPIRTLILSGMSFELNGVIDASNASRPLFIIVSDVRIMGGGEVTVPAAGVEFDGRIELFHPQARIAGPGTLTNGGEIRGSGQIEAPLVNDADGQINAVNDALTFTQTVTNNAGGQINAINGTLDFQSGLTNDGQLNLINTTILGSVTGGASGAASFVGENSVGGNLTMATGDSLSIRLGGALPGDFDTLTVGGNTGLAGALNVSLQGGFTPSPGDVFEFVEVGGLLTGEFNGLTENALVGNFGGTDLFVTYTGGDGNDVALFAPIPGDFNLDGKVNAADYVVWRKGISVPPTQTNYDIWRANFGQPAGAGATNQSFGRGTPEPAAFVLVLTAALICFAGCRQRTLAACGVGTV